MTADELHIPLLVTPGHYDDDSFNLRFPAEYSDEILALLDENSIVHSTALEMSADVDLWIESVRVLATPEGLLALAAVIHAVVRRNKGKKFTLKRGEFEIEAQGYSERAVVLFLKKQAAEQAEVDERWRKMFDSDLDERQD